ncbi:MAG TPA: phosphatidate cytidylyltransferase [Desulfomonilia bacterium]|nr:phosphatidate cytidylyltransferase [Desulfomonilia bacterium]
MKRILGALLLIVIFALPVIFGPAWVLLIVAMLVIPMCMYELFRVAIGPEAKALSWISIAVSVPFLLIAYRGDLAGCFLTITAAGVILIVTSLFLYEKEKAKAKDLVYSLVGLIYPLALTGFWVLLRVGVDGRFWIIFGLVCTFGSDAGAYYVGKNLGRRSLAPRLSPKKTVEGFIGGLCSSILLGYASFLIYKGVTEYFHADLLSGRYPSWLLVLLAIAIGVLDLAGDLTASLFKRDFQIKDLGNLIPGHGGMLDRMDGIILVGCILYLILKVAV